MDTEVSTTYELETEGFKGPLEKLLEFIDARQLEITRVNLAEITADFLSYLETLEKVSHKELANFVVVAARLVFIKSHALLPNIELSEDEEQDIADLERRLKLYKEFRVAEEYIKNSWEQRRAFSRPFLATIPQGFYLTEEVKPEQLQDSFKKLVQLVEDLKKLDTEEVHMINLEEQIKTILNRVNAIVRGSFNDLNQTGDRSEVIVTFLALLHLLKDNQINIIQEDAFGDIQVLSINNG